MKQVLIGSLSTTAFGVVQPVYALTIGGMISDVEVVYNHRIVISFQSLGIVLQLFGKAQDEPRREGRKWTCEKLVNVGEILAGDVFKTVNALTI
ncbi:hypothetical protein L1887_39230 [Cichorium endivia]|nr:hypothetical protein L1887_39230 [Cichorium endivia]